MINSKKPQQKHDRPHVARIFDTTTYHIPMSVDYHNRKSSLHPFVWILIWAFTIFGTIATSVILGII